jgi:hypothetical protein
MGQEPKRQNPSTDESASGLAAGIERLLSGGALDDPEIQAAFHWLDQIAAVVSPGKGKHRLAVPEITLLDRSRPGVHESGGDGSKPDPGMARTGFEFVQILRQYRIWAGKVPYRQMAARAHQAVGYSAMWVALNGTELPSLKVAAAIVIGCGGSTEDQERFIRAWHRVSAAPKSGLPD